MSGQRPAAGPASASGIRRGGDRYQDIFAWAAAMRLMQRDSPFTSLEVEARGVGNVDDVVLRSRDGADDFGQVKWSSVSGALLDEDFLTKKRTPTSSSLLQKLYMSYRELRPTDQARDSPSLQLITNRSCDPVHPLLGKIDGRSDLLVPYAANQTARSNGGKALTKWYEHVDTTREQFLEMLEHLRFTTGRTVSAETERVRALMESVGLKSDKDSLDKGLTAAADWVLGGRRTVSPDEVEAAIQRLSLRAGDPQAVLLIQSIDRDGHPEDATEVLDWVAHYEGETPRERVCPKHFASWETMQDDLEGAIQRLEDADWRRMTIRGAMRQATFFLAGTRASRTRGWALSYTQRRGSIYEAWNTETPRATVSVPAADHISVGAGNGLAVVVNFAVDATPAVLDFVKNENLPVQEILSLSPVGGAQDQSIESSAHAVGYTQHVISAIRSQIEQQPTTDRIHLFLAGPGGLALLLGHRWNRIKPTTVYEHLGIGAGYTPAFKIT